MVEEVLAVRLDSLEGGTIHTLCIGGEGSLRTRHDDRTSSEQFRVIPGDPVDGVSLGHGRRRYRFAA